MNHQYTVQTQCRHLRKEKKQGCNVKILPWCYSLNSLPKSHGQNEYLICKQYSIKSVKQTLKPHLWSYNPQLPEML